MRPALLNIVAVLAVALAPFSQADAVESRRSLNSKDLQALLVGNTLISVDDDGPYWIFYPTAETLWGRSASGDVDVGRWWIDKDAYCRAWRRWFEGRTRCWRMASEGADTVLWLSPEGNPEGRSVLRQGNAMGDLPQGSRSPSQLVDASTGLSSAVEPVVARGVSPAAAAARATGGSEDKPISGDRAGHSSPPLPRGPSVLKAPLAAQDNRSPSPTSGPAAEQATPADRLAGTRLGGFLDRLGVRRDPALSTAGNGDSGADRDGPSGKEGSDRDH